MGTGDLEPIQGREEDMKNIEIEESYSFSLRNYHTHKSHFPNNGRLSAVSRQVQEPGRSIVSVSNSIGGDDQSKRDDAVF